MSQELEYGNFYEAKTHYMKSLIDKSYVNHKIRQECLLRLMSINTRIHKGLNIPNALPYESPEKIMLARYYVKKKYVQIIIDTDSFKNSKTLKATMLLPKMIFRELE